MTGYPPDDRWEDPTLVAEVPPGTRGRHAASRSLRWRAAYLIAGGAVVLVLGVLTALALSGGTDTGAPQAAPPSSGDIVEDPFATTSPETSPTVSPEPSASTRTRPADLIAGLRSAVRHLDQTNQIGHGAAVHLDRRLQDAAQALADGDLVRTRQALADVADRAARLHADGDLSDGGYQTIAAMLTALGKVLPRA